MITFACIMVNFIRRSNFGVGYISSAHHTAEKQYVEYTECERIPCGTYIHSRNFSANISTHSTIRWFIMYVNTYYTHMMLMTVFDGVGSNPTRKMLCAQTDTFKPTACRSPELN